MSITDQYQYAVIRSKLTGSVPFIFHGLFASFDDAVDAVSKFVSGKGKDNTLIISVNVNEWITENQFQDIQQDNTRCTSMKLLDSAQFQQTIEKRQRRRRRTNADTRKLIQFNDLGTYLYNDSGDTSISGNDDFDVEGLGSSRSKQPSVAHFTKHNVDVQSQSMRLRTQYENDMKTVPMAPTKSRRRDRTRPIMDDDDDDEMKME